jgi:hypothetical protein
LAPPPRTTQPAAPEENEIEVAFQLLVGWAVSQ